MSWKRSTAALALSLQLPGALLAKPADLPIDLRINYAGDDSAPARPASAPTPAAPETPAPIAPAVLPSSPDARRAAEIFERAERHRQRGEWSDARRGFQEAHLLAPISRVGRQAIERLRDLERPGNTFAEDQEPPVNSIPKKPSREFLEMLRITLPLGAAERERY